MHKTTFVVPFFLLALLGQTAQAGVDTAIAQFSPPPDSAIPAGPFGDMVKLGKNIFNHTREYAPKYVGNSLSCANCHLAGGRLADSAPLWAAYPAYPAYRSKNKKVNSYQARLQGCFIYSMNGKAPPLDSNTLLALESYSFFLSKGAPVGDEKMAGRGFPKLPAPAEAPDLTRGKKVYEASCALCHNSNGAGRVVDAKVVFPPLWGKNSYNWGAGMHSVSTAASFIHANMPFGMPKTLTEQQAWDVAAYINSRPRPQDPRFKGSVEETRVKFHPNTKYDYYGQTIDGKQLGNPANTPPASTVPK
ncbi:c-type cytochrome [Halothiobacillus sp.]|jgi:thiosulfate dehydrogenase|uniref:c-type cytochrome n=1 Tax=Halothiobacillus sp. TaxID=1891311 RepID=UPI002AD33E46|nr:c-type cytochrome [Halothiobacillus sp.]